MNAGRELKPSALVEAYDVNSLVMEHCFIAGSVSSGIMVKSHQRNQMIVSSRCAGPGVEIQGGATESHLSICNSTIAHSVYGVFINSAAHFYVKKNEIYSNSLSGFVATGGCNGRLLKNNFVLNKRQGIFFAKRKRINRRELHFPKFMLGNFVLCWKQINMQRKRASKQLLWRPSYHIQW